MSPRFHKRDEGLPLAHSPIQKPTTYFPGPLLFDKHHLQAYDHGSAYLLLILWLFSRKTGPIIALPYSASSEAGDASSILTEG